MIRLEHVAARAGKSKRQIMRDVDEGRMPEPAIRAGRLVAWTDGVIARWFGRKRKRKGKKNGRRAPRKRVGTHP